MEGDLFKKMKTTFNLSFDLYQDFKENAYTKRGEKRSCQIKKLFFNYL